MYVFSLSVVTIFTVFIEIRVSDEINPSFWSEDYIKNERLPGDFSSPRLFHDIRP
jgi:hypothetical protein